MSIKPMRAAGGHQRFNCPDCNHPMRIAKTKDTGSPLLREKTYQCTDAENCGSTFGGHEEITRRISNGANPDPQLPLGLAGSGQDQ